jgi:hypothetical protein
MSTATAGSLLSPAGAPASRATLDRVRRYLSQVLGPQRGPTGVSIPAEGFAAAAADRGIAAVVERNPTIAVGRAAETDAAVPVVVSGSFHLLTAVHGAATVPP